MSATLPPCPAWYARRPRLGWRLALAVACLLVACGPATPEPALVVMEPGSFYAPGSLTIPVGSVVIWRNQDRIVHTVTAGPVLQTSTFQVEAALPEGVQPFDSGDLFSGYVWQRTFDIPGQYVYYCRYHANEQMIATIIVEEAP